METKRYWATMLKQTLLALAVSSLLAVLLDRIWNEPSDRDPLFAIILGPIVYLFVTTCIAIVHGISGALHLWLFLNTDVSDGVLDNLRRSKIAPPGDGDRKNMEYLEDLAADDTALIDDRLKAATLLGSYSAIIQRSGLFRGLAIRRAVDDAMLRYHRESPHKVC